MIKYIYREDNTDEREDDDDVEMLIINLEDNSNEASKLQDAMKSSAPIFLQLGGMVHIFSSYEEEEERLWKQYWEYKRTGDVTQDRSRELSYQDGEFLRKIKSLIKWKGDKIRGISVADRALEHFKPYLTNLKRLEMIEVKIKENPGENVNTVVDLIQKNSRTLKALMLQN